MSTPPEGVRAMDADPAPSSSDVAELSDHSLVVRVARRHPAALAELYERHRQPIGAVARALYGSRRADDAVWAVFLRLWQEPMDFAAPVASLRAHLLRAVDQLPEVSGFATAPPGADRPASPLQPAEGGETDESPTPLALLPQGEREALVLATFGGCTYRDIAQQLGLSESDILRRIRRGLERLRTLMAVGPSVAGQ